MTTADEYKAQGNDAFRAQDFEKAIDLFSKAIEVSENPNHVLYSNRSACYTSLHKYDDALKDAEKCVEINPTWAKGYNRVAAAYYGEGRFDDAEKQYQKALEIDPSNKMAKTGIEDVSKAKNAGGNPGIGLGQMFSDPQLIEKLKANPKTAEYMKDPALVQKVLNLQKDPSSVSKDLFSDPRLMSVVAAILGIDLKTGPGANTGGAPKPSDETPVRPETPMREKPEAEPKKEKEEPEAKADIIPERQQADKLKKEGNDLYKAHKFDEAIEKYNAAWKTYKDVTYLNNRAAAEFENKSYDTAIQTCTEAVEEGRAAHADYKVIAKSFARIGNCYVKKDDLPKAIEFYEKSLTEHRTASTLNKLRDAQRTLKKRETEAYMDKDKAEEARVKGNAEFKKGDWPAAVKEYTEMIKRDPTDPRGYSNRAAALSKLMSFPDAIQDCEDAIQRKPDFIRAYIRKANAEMAMKKYKDADDTLEKAKGIMKKNNDLNSPQMNEIYQLSQKALTQRFAPNEGETYELSLIHI